MRLRTRLLILLTTIGLLVATGAQAQSSRLYFAGYMGLNIGTKGDFDESTTGRSGNFEFDNGMSFAGAAGLRLTQQWRIEGEISYRKTDFDRVNFDGAGNFKEGGEMSTWLYMVNAYYDFDLKWKNVQPFVSAGIGLASHSGDINDGSALAPDASGSSIGFAYQVGGGLKYRVSDDMAFTGGYRYLGTTGGEFDSYDFDFGSHEFRVGLEYDLPIDWLK
jgi:opacity protein-like surface antigen